MTNAKQMIYRKLPSTGEEISVLGYGCMRFPRSGVAIDEARVKRLVGLAADKGVNFFDTAYLYPGSEKALGNALSGLGIRERVKISTKLPLMMVRKRQDIDNIFGKQLERLKTDYVDFYLAHSLTSFSDYERIVNKGFGDFIEDERKRGRILRAGFSFHGNAADFKRIVDAYPWDICVIQYNYLDEYFQAGVEGLKYAAAKGLGVVAMEPLRGGLLGGLPAAATKVFDGRQLNETPAELALRWIWKHPGITCAISGMSAEKYLEENIGSVYGLTALEAPAARVTDPGQDSASGAGPDAGQLKDAFDFTAQEYAAVAAMREYFRKNVRVPCTSCAYCTPCPHGVDIPTCFSWYNMGGGISAKMHYVIATEGAVNNKPSKASLCKACGACEARCPQKIKIADELKNVARAMEKGWLRVPMRIALRLISR
jgi:predicted aldo/keto reductase-like oxidoreductase